jgi:hypothetical protein
MLLKSQYIEQNILQVNYFELNLHAKIRIFFDMTMRNWDFNIKILSK